MNGFRVKVEQHEYLQTRIAISRQQRETETILERKLDAVVLILSIFPLQVADVNANLYFCEIQSR